LELYQTIKELVDIYGPVGHEEAVAEYLMKRWAGSCREVWQTPVGNVVGHLGGEGPKLLLTAHMDEIGFLVKSITRDGFVWLTNCHKGISMFHLREALNRRAVILTRDGRVEGVFATLTGHLRSVKVGHDEPVSWDNVYVDLGLDSREEVEALGVHPGCPVVYRAEAERVGHHIAMKAADARIGLAIITAAVEELSRADLAYDVYLAGTVQEEIGLVGASSLVAELGPFDAALVYEVGLAGDIPVVEDRDMPAALGQGPCLIYRDSTVHYARRLLHRLEDLAAANDIPVQRVVFDGFGADGSELMRQGVPTAMLAPPTRYSHSPYEMLNEEDVRRCAELTRAFCTTESEQERR
jgi:endoglucanase